MASIQAYTTKDVAEILGVKTRTVVDYIGAGLIKAVPWVGRTWLIQPKEVDRLKKVGIDTNGLHAKLKEGRLTKQLNAYMQPPPSLKNFVKEAAKIAVPKVAAPKPSEPSKPVALSVNDTRFATPPLKLRTVPKLQATPVKYEYHGKTLTPNEVKFIEWLQSWVKRGGESKDKPLSIIDGTSDQWYNRCGGILSVPEIKNILLFLRAKKFLVCDGCNTTYIVRNLDEFFTCPPVEGSVLPKSYKYT